MATKKKQVISTGEIPMKGEFIDEKVMEEALRVVPPTAPGETGNAPLTKPPQRNESKWQQ